MQAVVCIKWKCTSTEYEIRFIAYEFDSNTWRFRLCQLSQHWTGRRGWQYMQWDFLSVYHSVWAHACLYVCVCMCMRAVLFLHYGGRPWCSQQHAAAGRPPLSLPWGEQLLHKHAGVWAMSPWLPSSPPLLLLLVCSHTVTLRLTLTRSILSTHKHSNMSLCLLSLFWALLPPSVSTLREYRVSSKLVSAQNKDSGASDL